MSAGAGRPHASRDTADVTGGLAPGHTVEVAIDAIGARGDGVARRGGARIYVPLTQPGERARVRLTTRTGEGFAGEPVAWLRRLPSSPPRCSHFGLCGGCQLQHLPDAAYVAWKRDLVGDALSRRGLGEVEVEPVWLGPPACRRRARFAFVRSRAGVELGFRERRGHRPIDLTDCAVLLPRITDLVAPLRRLLDDLKPALRRGEVQVTAGASGLDLLLTTAGLPGLAAREALAAFAAERDLARLSWSDGRVVPEPVVQRREVIVRFGEVEVRPPADAFLQASAQAEGAIRDAVRGAIGPARRLADLFAGCGTFALPLAAEGREVHAVEAEASMVAAMAQGAKSSGLAGRLRAVVRDLQRTPLRQPELADLDAVVLDPPRAGARAQVQVLAGSEVPRIAMVSCHPPSFARDARTLVDGGHRLLWVRPIDAFAWSSRVELVAAFAR